MTKLHLGLLLHGDLVRDRCTIPELNPEMDVFRIGTLLELCRNIAETLAIDGKCVKVCVQQSMGQGVFQVYLMPTDGRSCRYSSYTPICKIVPCFGHQTVIDIRVPQIVLRALPYFEPQ